MKMKKLAAVALAVVMSVSMLARTEVGDSGYGI